MNNDIFYAIPIGTCIILSMYFFLRWMLYYTGIKKMNMSEMIKEGMNGLSYINKENPDFSEDDAKNLNRFRRNAYIFMILGIATIILKQILNYL